MNRQSQTHFRNLSSLIKLNLLSTQIINTLTSRRQTLSTISRIRQQALLRRHTAFLNLQITSTNHRLTLSQLPMQQSQNRRHIRIQQTSSTSTTNRINQHRNSTNRHHVTTMTTTRSHSLITLHSTLHNHPNSTIRRIIIRLTTPLRITNISRNLTRTNQTARISHRHNMTTIHRPLILTIRTMRITHPQTTISRRRNQSQPIQLTITIQVTTNQRHMMTQRSRPITNQSLSQPRLNRQLTLRLKPNIRPRHSLTQITIMRIRNNQYIQAQSHSRPNTIIRHTQNSTRLTITNRLLRPIRILLSHQVSNLPTQTRMNHQNHLRSTKRQIKRHTNSINTHILTSRHTLTNTNISHRRHTNITLTQIRRMRHITIRNRSHQQNHRQVLLQSLHPTLPTNTRTPRPFTTTVTHLRTNRTRRMIIISRRKSRTIILRTTLKLTNTRISTMRIRRTQITLIITSSRFIQRTTTSLHSQHTHTLQTRLTNFTTNRINHRSLRILITTSILQMRSIITNMNRKRATSTTITIINSQTNINKIITQYSPSIRRPITQNSMTGPTTIKTSLSTNTKQVTRRHLTQSRQRLNSQDHKQIQNLHNQTHHINHATNRHRHYNRHHRSGRQDHRQGPPQKGRKDMLHYP